MSQIIVHRRAAKYLQKLPKAERERIKSLLRQLSESPLETKGVRQMVGEWAGYHRLRVGAWRIIFWFEPDEDVVYVDHIGPRGDIYK